MHVHEHARPTIDRSLAPAAVAIWSTIPTIGILQGAIPRLRFSPELRFSIYLLLIAGGALTVLARLIRIKNGTITAVLVATVRHGATLTPDQHPNRERSRLWCASGIIACSSWTTAIILDIGIARHTLALAGVDLYILMTTLLAVAVVCSVMRMAGPSLATTSNVLAIGAEAHDRLHPEATNILPFRQTGS